MPGQHSGRNGVGNVFTGIFAPGRRVAEVGADPAVHCPHRDRSEEVIFEVDSIPGAMVVECKLDKNCRPVGDANLTGVPSSVLNSTVSPGRFAWECITDRVDYAVVNGVGEAQAIVDVGRFLHFRVTERFSSRAAARVCVIGNIYV